jgi:hypothetical protein
VNLGVWLIPVENLNRIEAFAIGFMSHLRWAIADAKSNIPMRSDITLKRNKFNGCSGQLVLVNFAVVTEQLNGI